MVKRTKRGLRRPPRWNATSGRVGENICSPRPRAAKGATEDGGRRTAGGVNCRMPNAEVPTRSEIAFHPLQRRENKKTAGGPFVWGFVICSIADSLPSPLQPAPKHKQ